MTAAETGDVKIKFDSWMMRQMMTNKLLNRVASFSSALGLNLRHSLIRQSRAIGISRSMSARTVFRHLAASRPSTDQSCSQPPYTRAEFWGQFPHGHIASVSRVTALFATSRGYQLGGGREKVRGGRNLRLEPTSLSSKRGPA